MSALSSLDRLGAGLLIASLGLNVGLIIKLQARPKIASNLVAGQRLPALSGKTLARGTLTVQFNAAQPTLFYVFTPECKYCTLNLPMIRELLTQVHKTHRMIGVSLVSTGLAEYLREKSLPFDDVVYDVEPALKEAYKLGGTPDTIIVSKDGRVEKNWLGAYSGKTQESIESFFHCICLPGGIAA